MNTFEMVVLIVLISVVAGVVNNYIKTRVDAAGAAAGGELDERIGRLELLEERVKILEKIVTDRDFELKEKFRNL